MLKKISVVIPSYNHSRYIEACLDSIYFQDYPNIELIIVDDKSSDNSQEVIANWINGVEVQVTSFASRYNEDNDEIERTIHKRYNRTGRTIKFYKNKENFGSTKNYNRGFRAATGDYCTFIASDDIAHPQLLSTLASPLDRDDADFVYCDMFVIDDQQRILREFKLPDYSFKKSFCDWYLCGVATLYRRDLHHLFGYYDESAMADDHECYLRFALGGARFLHIHKTLYSVRTHNNRKQGLHEKNRYKKLLDHSGRLTIKARKWLEKQHEK
jgi:glycosyltransferase involved in cell wall biosynthesis